MSALSRLPIADQARKLRDISVALVETYADAAARMKGPNGSSRDKEEILKAVAMTLVAAETLLAAARSVQDQIDPPEPVHAPVDPGPRPSLAGRARIRRREDTHAL